MHPPSASERTISLAGLLTLVHGDASLVNMRTGPDGQVALLDWAAHCAPCSATPPAHPGDRPDRQPLRTVQPANLRPIIHRQHLASLPGSARARLKGGGSVFAFRHWVSFHVPPTI